MNNQAKTAPYVAVIGAANMDLMGKVTGQAVDGDSNPGEVIVSAGGVARNIAENLAHLGTCCELITAIADDVWGAQLTEHCESVSVGMSHCIIAEAQRSSSYLSMHDNQGELITAINDMTVLNRINEAALAQRIDVLSQAACWVIDANLNEDALAYLFSQAGNIPIWVDSVSTIKAARLIPYLSAIHCLTPNREEAAVLTGDYANSSVSAPKLAQKLHDKGVDKVMITLGEKGAYTSDGHNTAWVKAQSSQVKNVTGCGDAAIAALVHGSVIGVDWQASCELAMSAAALTANSPQTNTPLLATLGTFT